MANDNDIGAYPFTSFNFLISLTIDDPGPIGARSPMCNGEFSECDGLEMTMEHKTVREGGNNGQQIHLAGPVSFGNLSLKRGMTRSLDLWNWFGAAAGSAGASTVRRGALAGAEIIMRDAAGNDTIRFRVFDCLPIKIKAAALNARDGVVAIEDMQIAYSHFTVEAA